MENEAFRDAGDGNVDWVHFEKSRAELGPGFIRILGLPSRSRAKMKVEVAR